MLVDLFGENAVSKVLDFIIDMKGPYTQKLVCERTGLSKPTVIKVFERLIDAGIIYQDKNKYKTNFESEAVRHLIRFDLGLTYHYAKKSNQMIAVVQ